MKPVALLMIVTTASWSASAQQPSLVDAALSHALLGVWCNSNDGGRTCWAYDEFFESGHFEACGQTEDDMRPFRGRGTFGVVGQRMCYEVTAASQNFWLQPGGRYCTDIVAIDEQTHRYRDIDTNVEFTLYRVSKSEKRCPGMP